MIGMLTSRVTPLISVIIPVYNGERYLSAAIESVLAQAWTPLEIIIVDDGSTDQSARVAQPYQPLVQVVHQANAGPGAARNRGITAARGELLAFLDADDLWLPGKLASQVAHLQKQPTLDMVFGQVEQFISPDLPAGHRPALPAQPVMNGLHVGAMLIRRQSFLAVGGFATHWAIGEFIDWYGRAQAVGLRAAILAEVVMRRRLHDNNLTRRTKAQRSDYLHILKRHLDARRGQPVVESSVQHEGLVV